MFGSGRSEYDRGLNTFSPEGRLFQVEYANAAIKIGATAIGICTPEGVILAVEKRMATGLIEATSVEKIFTIDEHCGAAISGLSADARTLVDHARVECQQHRFVYEEPLYVASLVESISDLALDFSDVSGEKRKRKMARPFGVALLVAGYDVKTKSFKLFKTEPSGNFTACQAVAIGAAAEGAITALVELFKENPLLSFAQAEVKALEILRLGMEEKMNAKNIEVAAVKTDGKFRVYEDSELAGVMSSLGDVVLA
jgi:20S proteasome subunit alpha 5